MTNYSKKTNRMDIYVEDHRGSILVQLKWKYDWTNKQGTTPWVYNEKKNFHDSADKLIWNIWSNQIIVKTKGTSSFAQKYASTGFRVNFDIKWVLSGEHWVVEVKKIPPGHFQTSSVNWYSSSITLDTEDINPVNRNRSGVACTQYPVSHEFGHAVGNSIYASTSMHGDEYRSTSQYFWDKLSIMNIGDEIRRRHIDFLILELNGLIPNTNFYI